MLDPKYQQLASHRVDLEVKEQCLPGGGFPSPQAFSWEIFMRIEASVTSCYLARFILWLVVLRCFKHLETY